MKGIITFTFCCSNLACGSGIRLENSGNFFSYFVVTLICNDGSLLGLSLPAVDGLTNDMIVWKSVAHNLGCQYPASASSSSDH